MTTSEKDRTALKRTLAEDSAYIEEEEKKQRMKNGPQAKRQKTESKQDPYPSLTKRAKAVGDAIQPFCGNHQFPKELVALISEFSLLPPSEADYCIDEKSNNPPGEGLNRSVAMYNPVSETDDDIPWKTPDGEDVRFVYFEWSSHIAKTQTMTCRLSLIVGVVDTIVSSPSSEDEGYHVGMKTVRSIVMGGNEFVPSDLIGYGVFKERQFEIFSDLSIASLSFYYREFLAGRCQCGAVLCNGK
jgi:hypothetical protein